MLRMKFFSFVIFTHLSLSLFSQNSKEFDSLQTKPRLAIDDTTKLRLRVEAGETSMIFRLGYWDSIIEDAGKSGIPGIKARALNNSGFICLKLGSIKNALEYFHRSLKIQEDISDREGMAVSLINIGNIYGIQKADSLALKYYKNAMEIQQSISDRAGLAVSLNNIGNYYENKGEIIRAFDYYRKSLEMEEALGNKKGISASLNNIGVLQYKQGNMPEALKYHFKSLEICKGLSDKEGLANCCHNIGKVYEKLGRLEDAARYFQESLRFAQESGFPENVRNAAKALKEIYQRQNKAKEALRMYDLYIQMKDSISNDEIRNESIGREYQYEYEKRQLIENAVHQKKNLLLANEIKRKKIVLGAIIAMLIALSVIAFLLFRQQYLKRKKDEVIFKGKQALFEKETELLKSERERARDELVHAQALLGNYIAGMLEKSKMLDKFEAEIQNLRELKSKELYEKKIEDLHLLTGFTLLTEEDWDKFKRLFDQVYKGFFIRLKERLPDLTPAEIRLICLTKLKLDTKQMARILGVSADTVNKTRYRLRKKIKSYGELDFELLAELT